MDQGFKSTSRLPLYNTWNKMKYRCYNTSCKDYVNWGGRGIKVCDKWLNSYKSFEEDMLPSYKKGLSLDRINNDGNYEPSNCRWATNREQCNNKRTNVVATFDGYTGTMTQLAEKYSIKKKTLWQRIHNYGWSLQDSLLTPVNKRRV